MTEHGGHGIITGGTWCADHNKLVERWPGEDELVKIISENVRGGGSACNLAIDIKRLDSKLPVATIGLLGDDADGERLLDQAKIEGLDCSQLQLVPDNRTTFTDAYTSKDTGRRTHLFHSGISQILCPDHFDFSSTNARIFHLGLPGLHAVMDDSWKGDENGWVTVLKKAKAAGLKTNLELCSLEPEDLQELVRPCLKYLDYFIVNEFEIAAVAGQPIGHGKATDVQTCIMNAKRVLGASALELVIVHFPMGAVAVNRNGGHLVTPSVDMAADQIVGTNGAGDAFAAGALYGIHQGWELTQMLSLAHASAAVSMRHIGTTDGATGWEKCLQFASQCGWREL